MDFVTGPYTSRRSSHVLDLLLVQFCAGCEFGRGEGFYCHFSKAFAGAHKFKVTVALTQTVYRFV